MTAEEEYREGFGVDTAPPDGKAKEALLLALDIRKFEIGLYWQRTAYCWALIAAAFAGYFAVAAAEHLQDREYLAFLVASIGLVFTWGWYLVNRGSKFWQENWENHVDMLEDGFVGPLYKTILHRPGNLQRSLVGPLPISVSEVNLVVSMFTAFIWIVLIVHAFPNGDSKLRDDWKYFGVLAVTTIVLAYMYFGCKTGFGPHSPVRKVRKVRILDL